MEPGPLLELFGDVCEAITRALAPVQGTERRARTARPGPVRDRPHRRRSRAVGAARPRPADRERGVGGHRAAEGADHGGRRPGRRLEQRVAQPPVLGDEPVRARRPGAARGDGREPRDAPRSPPRCAGGARSGTTCRCRRRRSSASRTAFVALSTFPNRMLHWKQFRAMGSCTLALCDVAAGNFDGYFDGGSVHAPWDYLGGYLVCLEAGAHRRRPRPTGPLGSPTRTSAGTWSPRGRPSCSPRCGRPRGERAAPPGRRREPSLDLAALTDAAEAAARAARSCSPASVIPPTCGRSRPATG